MVVGGGCCCWWLGNGKIICVFAQICVIFVHHVVNADVSHVGHASVPQQSIISNANA